MAQIRRPPRYRSPPPRQIPSLPNPIRLRTLAQQNDRSITQTVHHPPQNGVSQDKQYDPVTGLMIPRNHEQSSLNHERQQENIPSIQQPIQNNTIEESIILPTLHDDDELSVMTTAKKHLPVFARFPFDVSFLPQPMETNVEDNIHKLRLRLIDSELNHQRRSTDEYIKRTQRELSLSSPMPAGYYVRSGRSPTELVHQHVVPKILSRETALSKLTVADPILMRDRIGMENDLQGSMDIERELEIRRIQESLNNGRRTNRPMKVSNYSHDPRLHLHSLDEERQYSSSNMDDLIDSMARRHLAYRRLDAAIDRQRRSNGYHGSYIEPLGAARSPHRNDHLYHTNRTPRNHTERDFVRTNPNDFNQMLRSRIDYYNRIQPDTDNMGFDDTIRANSYKKLPPISHGHDSNRSNHSHIPSKPILSQTKYRNHQQSSPLNTSNHSEHLIELPSEIFLSARTEGVSSSQRHQRSKPRSISKERRSETDRSDGENQLSVVNHERSHDGENDYDGFFTESNIQQEKKANLRRHLFKKVAIGILFIIALQRQANKQRLNRQHQSASATIHKIRLQEIIVALHRVYLEPDSPIYNALIQAITNPISLKDGLNSSAKHHSEAIKIIGDALKNILSTIVEFMPKDGILGTEKTSAIAALIQDGNQFPENYFWQCERELLEFDNSKVINITKQRAIVLLLGLFIFRALVTTLLIKPIKYRLILGQLTSNQSANLKVLASVMLYVGRRAAGANSHLLALPDEWQLSLYTDTDIKAIIQHSEIKLIMEICEQSLRMWCEEYVRRIDASFDKELRI